MCQQAEMDGSLDAAALDTREAAGQRLLYLRGKEQQPVLLQKKLIRSSLRRQLAGMLVIDCSIDPAVLVGQTSSQP